MEATGDGRTLDSVGKKGVLSRLQDTGPAPQSVPVAQRFIGICPIDPRVLRLWRGNPHDPSLHLLGNASGLMSVALCLVLYDRKDQPCSNCCQ